MATGILRWAFLLYCDQRLLVDKLVAPTTWTSKFLHLN